MNLAHVHLILNHIPIIGIPVALLFLSFGVMAKQVALQRFALQVLVGISLMVLPVYFTGEPAEEIVEHLPNVAESSIESHEEAAETSLILTLVTGVAGIAALWFQRNETQGRRATYAVMGLASAAFLSLIYTASLGGQIRHTELRSDQAGVASASRDVNAAVGGDQGELGDDEDED